jgi:hypothetical protein
VPAVRLALLLSFGALWGRLSTPNNLSNSQSPPSYLPVTSQLNTIIMRPVREV